MPYSVTAMLPVGGYPTGSLHCRQVRADSNNPYRMLSLPKSGQFVFDKHLVWSIFTVLRNYPTNIDSEHLAVRNARASQVDCVC